MSTQLVGVFNFPILRFEEGKSATGVAFFVTGGYTQAVSLPSGSFSKYSLIADLSIVSLVLSSSIE